MSGFIPLWPGQASAHAVALDTLIAGFTVLIVLLSAPVFLLMLVFAVKYRRGKTADRLHPADRSIGLETSWALIPFFLVLFFFVWSAWLYYELHRPPADALEIFVVAKQWMWKAQHPGGQAEINELHVPVDEPVKLTMISQDVIHSLFMPALRLKQDVLPGRYETMWFVADKPGTYRMTCAEFCGTDHSLMGGAFVVLSQTDYARWLERWTVSGSLAAQGKALFTSLGCSGCHGSSATVHAPPLGNLYGHPAPLQSGDVVTADDGYLRDSILLPNKQIAAGYPAIMPTFQNVLDEGQVMALVAYIKSLAPEPRP